MTLLLNMFNSKISKVYPRNNFAQLSLNLTKITHPFYWLLAACVLQSCFATIACAESSSQRSISSATKSEFSVSSSSLANVEEPQENQHSEMHSSTPTVNDPVPNLENKIEVKHTKKSFWDRFKKTKNKTENKTTEIPIINTPIEMSSTSNKSEASVKPIAGAIENTSSQISSSISNETLIDTSAETLKNNGIYNDDEPDYSNEPNEIDELENVGAEQTQNGLQNSSAIITSETNSETGILPTWLDNGKTKNNSTFSITNKQENYVAEFENFVASKIVPNVPGLALAIIADGKVKVLKAYGVKKLGSRDFVNTNTAFRLASVSKTIASTAAAVMVHDGKMNWDTTITTVLPEVIFSNARYGDKITVRDILSQATGLPTHTYTHLIEANMPYAETVNRLRYVNFTCPPGKCYAYQNVTYSLIGNIIFKKTGTTYDKYVKEKLFKPLGMDTASFGLEGLRATDNFAQPHVMSRRRWLTTDIDENYYHIYPAAGANASITDMSRWVLAQMGHNPDILPSEILRELHEKVTRNTPAQSHYAANLGTTDTHYGLGWRVFDYRGDKNFVHHGGWVKGFRSEVVFNQELQIGMVFLTNSESKLARNIIFKFLDAYEDERKGKRTLIEQFVPVKKKRSKKYR